MCTYYEYEGAWESRHLFDKIVPQKRSGLKSIKNIFCFYFVFAPPLPNEQQRAHLKTIVWCFDIKSCPKLLSAHLYAVLEAHFSGKEVVSGRTFALFAIRQEQRGRNGIFPIPTFATKCFVFNVTNIALLTDQKANKILSRDFVWALRRLHAKNSL